MRLLEYEAKELLRQSTITIPRSVLFKRDTLPDTAPFLPCVIKSQVPVGKRNQYGGIAIVKTENEFINALNTVATSSIQEYTPTHILVEELLDIEFEVYLSLIINKERGEIELLIHKNGGVSIEDEPYENFLHVAYTPSDPSLALMVAEYLGMEAMEFAIGELIDKLGLCMRKNDAALIEINPLVVSHEKLIAADCKLEVDDAATFRHPEWNFEYAPDNHNFVVIDEKGSVATIANGAGLAMATVDAVYSVGATPLNFLDIGGGASRDSVIASFTTIMEYSSVTAILINIFAGITRCDEVAQAIVAAVKEFPELPQLFIRLEGTASDDAQVILRDANIKSFTSFPELLAALEGELKK